MRKWYLAIVSVFFMSPVWADISLDPLLNKVTLQLNAEQWVATKSALVNVNINASVNDTTIEKVHSQVLDKLNRIAKGDWHILSYDRSQDKSGLESIQMIAQARLLETDLGGLRDKAKAISKPGETYTIDVVQFTPSEDEVRDANNALRANIYDQAKAELARLNKAYPEQKYSVHDINFVTEAMPAPMMQSMMVKNGDNRAARAPLAVGDKLHVYATVVLATSPDSTFAKLHS
ncbi:MAG: hypothetical protein ACYCQI_08985 [Gammaproteobacteria bacterium]